MELTVGRSIRAKLGLSEHVTPEAMIDALSRFTATEATPKTLMVDPALRAKLGLNDNATSQDFVEAVSRLAEASRARKATHAAGQADRDADALYREVFGDDAPSARPPASTPDQPPPVSDDELYRQVFESDPAPALSAEDAALYRDVFGEA